MSDRRELTRAVYSLLSAAKNRQQLADKLAAYLISERRTKEVNALLRDLEALRLDEDGILEVSVTAARPVSEAVRREIKQLFEAKEIIIHEEIDPALLGGVKVQAHEERLDLSVRARLQRLKTGA